MPQGSGATKSPRGTEASGVQVVSSTERRCSRRWRRGCRPAGPRDHPRHPNIWRSCLRLWGGGCLSTRVWGAAAPPPASPRSARRTPARGGVGGGHGHPHPSGPITAPPSGSALIFPKLKSAAAVKIEAATVQRRVTADFDKSVLRAGDGDKLAARPPRTARGHQPPRRRHHPRTPLGPGGRQPLHLTSWWQRKRPVPGRGVFPPVPVPGGGSGSLSPGPGPQPWLRPLVWVLAMWWQRPGGPGSP